MRLKIFVTVFLIYLFYAAPNFTSANTTRYFELTKSIVKNKSFEIDPASTMDKAFYKGRCYISAAPGLSFMAVPVYYFMRGMDTETIQMIYIVLFSCLPAALIPVMLYEILGRYTEGRKRLLIVFVGAFGTTLFFYSTRFMCHASSTFFIFAGFYFLLKEKKTFLAGISTGMAVLTNYLLLIGAAIFLFYIIITRKGLLKFILGAAPFALMFMYYHWRCFDNPFSIGDVTTYAVLNGPHSLAMPRLKVMYEMTFGGYRGLFSYMPVLALSVYGIFKIKGIEKWLIASFSLSVFFLVAGLHFWEGGLSFGPRHIISIVPFLIVPLAGVNYKLIYTFGAVSIFINWCGVQYGEASVFYTNVTTFLARGMNSPLFAWIYSLVHGEGARYESYSPLAPFALLIFLIFLLWRSGGNPEL
ncbi:MAG: hypothetical protein JW994_01845 [Candidatus Omnitrophica bacterium]|nr:hypothetical protein [Candidatus Omnitrophota bacterium]